MHDRDKGRVYSNYKMTMIIGSVPYSNAIPLTAALKQPIKKFTPTQLVKALRDDEIDMGLIPIYSAIKNGWHLYPEAGLIGCDGEVKSVRFFIKDDIELSRARTIYFDRESQTATCLAKIILKEHIKNISYQERYFWAKDFCLEEKLERLSSKYS